MNSLLANLFNLTKTRQTLTDEVKKKYVALEAAKEYPNIDLLSHLCCVFQGMILAAAAAVICDSSLEAWVTDVEDSDSSTDETSFGRTDFSTCVQCKGENHNPLYRYCEKCFQVDIDSIRQSLVNLHGFMDDVILGLFFSFLSL